jgi:hypothetical protein
MPWVSSLWHLYHQIDFSCIHNSPNKPDCQFQVAVPGQRIVRAPQPGTVANQSPVMPRRLVLTQSAGHQVTPVPRQVMQQAPKGRTVVLRGTNSGTKPVQQQQRVVAQQQGAPSRQAVSICSLAFSVADSFALWGMKTLVQLIPWASYNKIFFWHNSHCQRIDQWDVFILFSFFTVFPFLFLSMSVLCYYVFLYLPEPSCLASFQRSLPFK